jgi:sporulation protein YlmC with PRC-barrel domain
MKKHILILIIVIIASALVTANTYAGEMMKTMSKDSLVGSTVKNLKGEKLGKISDVDFDDQGNITFAILSHGGVLGIGEKMIPIPLNALKSEDEKLLTVDISKEKLETAPSFTRDTRPDMTNRAWVEDTSRFYGVRPYWVESGAEQKMEEMKEMKKMTPMKEPMKDIEEMEEEAEEDK